jgi:PPOX class probable F420-dependent enzyme
LVDDTLYTALDAKPKRSRDLRRLRNIEGNPEVAVLVDEYHDDWSRLWWCRLDGRARVVSDGERFEIGLQRLAEKYRQYRDDPPAGPVIVVDVTAVSGWSAAIEGRG